MKIFDIAKKLREIENEMKEILVSNSNLSKLPRLAKNGFDFLDQELIGITSFTQFVPSSSTYTETEVKDWEGFQKRYEEYIEVQVRKLIPKILFGGNLNGKLYWHQGKTFATCLTTNKDVILSVPTGMGKTEAFLLPIFNDIVKELKGARKRKLMALLIYPTKTLENDQFNRIIRYVYELNEILKKYNEGPIKIGIWDADTPEGSKRKRIEEEEEEGRLVYVHDSFIRGFTCPKCDDSEQLRWDSSPSHQGPYCKKCGSHFDWIYVTRTTIQSTGVHLMITNPEALEYSLILNHRFIQDGIDNLKYLVVDEAHMWAGSSGFYIKLLILRLKQVFKSKFRTILSSATLPNANDFATGLLGSDSNVEVVQFRKASLKTSGTVDYSSINPTNPYLIFSYLDMIKKGYKKDHVVDYLSKNGYGGNIAPNLIELCEYLGMTKNLTLTKIGEKIYEKYGGKYNFEELLPKNEEFIAELLSDFELRETLFEVMSHVPELVRFYEQFNLESTPLIKDVADLLGFMKKNSNKKIDLEVLETVIDLVRMSGMLLDRYHIFIKYANSIYYCNSCKKVVSTEVCQCGTLCQRLFFCPKCHEIVSELDKECAICGKKIDPKFFYMEQKMFTSYIISILMRGLESKDPDSISTREKILIFANARMQAERLTEISIDTDIPLVVQRLLLRQLLEGNNEPVSLNEVREKLRQLVLNEYFHKVDCWLASDKKHREGYVQRLNHISNLFDSNTYYRMYDSCLLSFLYVDFFDSPKDKIIVHELFKRITLQNRASIAKGVDLHGIKVSKLVDHVVKKLPKLDSNILKLDVEKVLRKLTLEKHILIKSVKEILGDPNCPIQGTNINGPGNLSEEKIVLLPSESSQNWELYFWASKSNIVIKIPEHVQICKMCYSAFPTKNLSKCPVCDKSDLVYVNRLREGYSQEKVDGFRKNAPFGYLDHWGYTLMKSVKEDSITRLIFKVHRRDISPEERTAIERDFKKSLPGVNVIFSTTTFELGIDVGNLNSILNVGLPSFFNQYEQRIGRAGRKRIKLALAFTVIRNNHPLDEYFTSDKLKLEQYIDRRSEEIFLQNNMKIIVANMLSHIIRYLNLNSRKFQTYNSINDEQITQIRAPKIKQMIETKLKPSLRELIKDISERKKDIEEELRATFRDYCNQVEIEYILGEVIQNIDTQLTEFIKLLNAYFQEELPLPEENQTQIKTAFRTFVGLIAQVGFVAKIRGGSLSSLSSNNRLPITTYKSNGQEKYDDDLDINQFINEAYPGPYREDMTPKTGYGAIRLSGGVIRARINKTFVEPKTISEGIGICTNPYCVLQGLAFDFSLEECPDCSKPLEKFTIFRPVCSFAQEVRRGSSLETTPLKVVFIDERSITPKLNYLGDLLELKRNNAQKNVQEKGFSNLKLKYIEDASVVTFVPYFRTRGEEVSAENKEDSLVFYREQTCEKCKKLMRLNEGNEEKHRFVCKCGNSKEVRTKDTYVIYNQRSVGILEEGEPKGPIGYKYSTNVLKISLPLSKLKEDLLGPTASFAVSLQKATTLLFKVDINELDISYTFTNDEAIVYLIETTEGGSGIGSKVLKNFGNVVKKIEELTRCNKCSAFCSDCILVPNIDLEILKYHLDKKYVRDFIK